MGYGDEITYLKSSPAAASSFKMTAVVRENVFDRPLSRQEFDGRIGGVKFR